MALRRAPTATKRDSEDVFQEACLGAVKAAGKFRSDGGAAFKTYAGRASFGAAVDSFRRGKYPRVHEPLGPRTNEIPAEAAKPKTDAIRALSNALRELDPPQPQIIILLHFREWSRKEVAAELGMSLQRVTLLHDQAMGFLRSYLPRRYKLRDLL